MDGATQKLVESSIHRTLHAHSFSRASSVATHTLADLLSRYLHLLLQSCAQYAQHAGHTSINVHDALHALDDLGFSLDELKQYAQGEAVDMARAGYGFRTSFSSRRAEELAEMRAHLHDGLKQERDDTIPLVYAPLDPDLDYPSSDSGEESEDEVLSALQLQSDPKPLAQEAEHEDDQPPAPIPPPRMPSPRMPLSPPPSPHPHKRHKKNGWNAPDYVPEFLPPFPKIVYPGDESIEPFDLDVESALPSRAQSTQPQSQPEHVPIVKIENMPAPIPPPTAAMSSSSDYTDLNPIPYSQSSLADLPEWHLPLAPPELDVEPPSAVNGNGPKSIKTGELHPRLATWGAAHHVLTTRPPATTTVQTSSSGVHTIPMSTQGRHAVLLTLLSTLNNMPNTGMRHMDVPDSLYGAVQPNYRGSAVGRLGGSHPVPVGGKRDANGNPIKPGLDKGKMQNMKWPIPTSRSTLSGDSGVAEMSTRLEGKLNTVARDVLSSNVYKRITKLTHPPPLWKSSNVADTYGPGIPAPWNSVPSKDDEKSGSHEDKERVAPDARLFVTWEYETKKGTDPLPSGPGRAGQVNGRTPRVGLPTSGSSSKLGAALTRKSKPGAPTLKLNLGGPRNGAPGKASR